MTSSAKSSDSSDLIAASASHLDEVATWPTSQADCDIWSGRRVRFPIDRDRLETEIAFDSMTNYALVREGRLLAFGQVDRRSRGRAHIVRIIVSPAERGYGLGELFVRLLFEAARAGAYQSVSLNVDLGNQPAERLYERLGFVYVLRPSEDVATPNCRYMEYRLPS